MIRYMQEIHFYFRQRCLIYSSWYFWQLFKKKLILTILAPFLLFWERVELLKNKKRNKTKISILINHCSYLLMGHKLKFLISQALHSTNILLCKIAVWVKLICIQSYCKDILVLILEDRAFTNKTHT